MSKSASERVFGLADLVDCICENAAIRNDNDKLINPDFFTKFVRINKLAATPALREIWRHLDGHSARNVVELLPENTVAQLTVIRGGDRPKTKWQIAELELERFFFYCKMVEFFHLSESSSIGSTRLNDLLNLVQRCMPSKVVFPRLKSLSFPLTQSHYNPNLTGLDLTQVVHVSVHSLAAFPSRLIHITPLFPAIRTLELTSDSVTLPLWKETVKMAVSTMPSLQNLAIAMIKFNARTPNHSEALNITSSSSRQPSRDLILKMTAGDFDILPTLLKHSQSVSISQSVLIFDVIDKKTIKQPSIDQAITTIADTCPSLKMLTISSDELLSDFFFYLMRSRRDGILGIASQTLQPLTRLRGITTLDLRLAAALIITPKFLNQMADSWISLQYCYLSPLNRFELEKNNEPLLHLPNIVHFASRCPSLHTLGVLFDLEPETIESSPLLVARAMKLLDVGSSGISDHKRTASIITTAFPFLDSLKWAKPSFRSMMRMSDGESKEWAKTQKLVFGLCS
ncbi:hypothetical protein FRC18_006591 [Serendipita sp. 400]|nr:hypothetical protein FRC18_006591 [Serendipita sp. 400]